MSNGLIVKKRNGSIEPLDLEKMHKMVEEACKDLAGVSASQVEIQSGIQKLWSYLTMGSINWSGVLLLHLVMHFLLLEVLYKSQFQVIRMRLVG